MECPDCHHVDQMASRFCTACGSMDIGERKITRTSLTLEQKLERAERRLAYLQALDDPDIETIEIEDDPNIETIEVDNIDDY